MAFVTPDEELPAQKQAANQQAPISAGGQGIGGSTKAAAAPGVNVPAQPSAQLKDYLNANKPQATNFAGQVAADVSANNTAAAQAIPQAVDTYTGQLYTVPTDATVNNQVATRPSGLTDGQKATYQAELGAASNAPNSASTFETTKPYQDLTGQVQKNVETANLWNAGNNTSSLATALSPYEAQTATAGDKTLDALLLSGTPGAYSQISKAVAPAAGLQDQLNAGTTKANDALRNAVVQDQAATDSANQSAQSYAQNLTAYLQNAVKSAQDAATSQNSKNNALTTDINSGAITKDEAIAMGIDPAKADAFVLAFNKINPAINLSNSFIANPTRSELPLGINPLALSSYLTQPTGAAPSINAATVASPEQYSDIAVLQSLLGGSAPAVPIDSSTAGLAGIGLTPPPAATYDLGSLQSLALKDLNIATPNYSRMLSQDAYDPAQNPGQGAVISQAETTARNILDYLNAFVGSDQNIPGGSFIRPL